MAATYIPIASTTLATSAASVTFSAIPATYTDLVVKASAKRSISGANNGSWTINGTTANYSFRRLRGTGSSVASTNGSSLSSLEYGTLNGTESDAFSSFEIYIPNYLASANKPISIFAVSEANATTAYINAHAQLWSNTSAITSLTLSMTNSWAADSTFHLYGIKNS